ncbi:MAG: amidase [Azoarcus sp.]|nr:MAG: amidase [Azoarcus sp.]
MLDHGTAATPLKPSEAATMLWQLSAQELTTAFSAGQLDPLLVLEHTLRRIEAVQPALNAIVEYDIEGAREAAAQSARRWRQGQPRSGLDGVVVTIKDNIPVAGLHCAWGSRLYAGHVPTRDELAVARLRAAGAVILGKTNVPEFTLQGYTDNAVHGTTHNPWNPALTPGGSSGGAVAAVASGMGPIALGTDGGGSIRRPAGFTGLAGLKPSWAMVPRRDGLPEILPGMEVVGPIARTVTDLTSIMRIISAAPEQHWETTSQAPGPLRIAYWRSIGDAPVDPDIIERVDSVALGLRALGHTVEVKLAPDCIAAFNRDAWPVLSSTGLASVLGPRLAHRHELTPAIEAMLEQGLRCRATDLFEAQGLVRSMCATLTGLFSDYDLILSPTSAALPWTAVDSHPALISGKMVDGRGHAIFTAFANAAGLPGLSLPAAPAPNGLPIGFQLVGPQGSDALLLALGLAFESRYPWHARWPQLG